MYQHPNMTIYDLYKRALFVESVAFEWEPNRDGEVKSALIELNRLRREIDTRLGEIDQ